MSKLMTGFADGDISVHSGAEKLAEDEELMELIKHVVEGMKAGLSEEENQAAWELKFPNSTSWIGK